VPNRVGRLTLSPACLPLEQSGLDPRIHPGLQPACPWSETEGVLAFLQARVVRHPFECLYQRLSSFELLSDLLEGLEFPLPLRPSPDFAHVDSLILAHQDRL